MAVLLAMGLLFALDTPAYMAVATHWGIQPYRTPFIDLEYLGAAAECWNKGVNVYVVNPCDVMNRLFTYSPLWLRASFIPAGRFWTNGMGVVLGLVFILCSAWLVRPRRTADALVLLLLLLSTDAAFAVERGNVDVLLFVLAAGAVALTAGSLAVRLVAYALVLVAGLLKFYPLVGLAYALRERFAVLLAVAAVAAAVLAAFVLGLGSELRAMAANIPAGSPFDEKFGAVNLPSGLTNTVLRAVPSLATPSGRLAVRSLLFAALLVPTLGLAAWWVSRPGFRAAFARLDVRAEATLVYGALIMVGCYFAGQSIAYRGIWNIMVAAGLLALVRVSEHRGLRAGLGAMVVLVLLLMWEGAVRWALRDTPNDPTIWFSAFWLLRELLWWVYVAFLLAVIGVFVGRSPSWALLRGRQP